MMGDMAERSDNHHAAKLARAAAFMRACAICDDMLTTWNAATTDDNAKGK
jgi:hypothetical protein